MTDHRIGMTVHGLPRIMDGDLEDLIEAIAAHDRAKKTDEAYQRVGSQ